MRVNKKKLFAEIFPQPTAVGTGLIALDVIINGHNKKEPFFMTGGSCGNVLIILSYLGWCSFPIGRLREGNFSQFIIKDMEKWGVDTSYLDFDDKATTPVIIEKVRKNGDNGSTHTFSFYCPECNSFLPRYRPITIKQVDSLLQKKIPNSDICYIDRISSGSLKLAKAFKDMGAIIFFEPTKINDDKQFHAILKISDILKYSDDIPIADMKIVDQCDVPLKIETRGSSGLAYLLRNDQVQNKKWKTMKAFQVLNVIDTAGSGDWCSAGIIHFLKKENISTINQLDENKLKNGLMFGQALAGLNCQFYGARGCMYSLSKEKFQHSIVDLLNKDEGNIVGDISTLKNPKKSKGYCLICNEKLRE